MERLETFTNGGFFVWGFAECGNNALSREKGHRQCFSSSFVQAHYETGESIQTAAKDAADHDE
jgi:hypothetical protein